MLKMRVLCLAVFLACADLAFSKRIHVPQETTPDGHACRRRRCDYVEGQSPPAAPPPPPSARETTPDGHACRRRRCDYVEGQARPSPPPPPPSARETTASGHPCRRRRCDYIERPPPPPPPPPAPRTLYTETAVPPNSLTEASSKEDYLRVVDSFLMGQPRNSNGLLQTYGPGRLGGGACGGACKLYEECPAANAGARRDRECRHDVYDNALAAIYLTKRGKLAEAKAILDAFLHLMYPTEPVQHAFAPNETLSGRRLSLLAASYARATASPGDYFYPVTTAAGSFVDVGNMAWAGMAFSRYAAATGDACYATAARDILHVLRAHRCDDEYGGFMGRFAPTNEHYRSIEHNIDMFSFARMLGATEDQESAAKFVRNMYFERNQYFPFDGAYIVGTTGSQRCDTNFNHGALPIDAQVWSAAASVEDNVAHERTALDFAVFDEHGGWATDVDHIGANGGEGTGDVYEGMLFSNAGHGIQWEITASGAVGMAQHVHARGGAALDVSVKLEAARDSLKRLLRRYSSVPGSIRGGNYYRWRAEEYWSQFPGGSDTGLGWVYLRFPHVASTVWAGLMLIQQEHAGAPFDPEGNPFSPPSAPVPAASNAFLECMR